MIVLSRGQLHVLALAGYVVVALAFTWPLPLHLSSALTGSPDGDTGVYIWNQWVFQHEILDNRSLPYFTHTIFSLTRPANLGLHNYTTFQNLVALPLLRFLGVVTTFNLVYLVMMILTAYMAFLLARHVTGRNAESWLAGLAFGWSPVLVTRGMGHFSVAAAAPLAAFLFVLVRTEEQESVRDAVLLGVTVWWAATTDVYFAVYCLLLAGVFLAARTVTVERTVRTSRRRTVPWALDVMLLCVGGLVVSMLVSGGWQFTVLGRSAHVRSLYTPMLVFTALALLRLGWRYRTRLVPVEPARVWRIVRLASTSGLLAGVLLSPVLYAVGVRIADNGFETERTFWRSSPQGVDLAAFILPNPNHPLAFSAIREWLTPRPDAYFENVASLPLVALLVIVLAWCRGWVIPRLWLGFAMLFGMLSLGPFINVAGVNTYVPGPWALLRYVPVIGLARTPARFTTVLVLMIAMLFASALAWLTARYPTRRHALLAGVATLLLCELLPAPRTLYSAEMPRIYRYVAAAPEDARVLELPFGVRDGTKSVGNFTARSQFFQTYHHKALFGGYLSRVSRRRVSEIRQLEVLDSLIRLSEGMPLGPAAVSRLLSQAPEFTARSRLEFVVIDRGHASDALRELAIRAFRLHHVDTDGDFELYRPSPTL
jgi:hypothetical protein